MSRMCPFLPILFCIISFITVLLMSVNNKIPTNTAIRHASLQRSLRLLLSSEAGMIPRTGVFYLILFSVLKVYE